MRTFIAVFLTVLSCATDATRSELSQGRIVGGRDAAPGEAPYMIAIKLVWEALPLPQQTICSGVLLNPGWVLTVSPNVRGFQSRDKRAENVSRLHIA